MAVKWVVEVEHDAIDPAGIYFLAIRPVTRMTLHMFAARGLNGKSCWSEKPGIAKKFLGETIVEHLRNTPSQVAVIVPDDADKRWRARKNRTR